MSSRELLAELRHQLADGQVTADEVLQAIAPFTKKSGLATHLSTILYFLGGGVVFLGLVFLIGQQWNLFGPLLRIFITLGSAIAALVTGVLLDRQRGLGAAGSAFFLLSALLLPAGLIVTYDEAGIRYSDIVTAIHIIGILAIVYLGLFLLHRRTVLLLFAILFGTSFVVIVTDYLMVLAPVFDGFHYSTYRLLFLGLAWMFLGHGLSTTDHVRLTGWLYGFGVLGFLGAGLALGEWKPHQNVFWELIYPGLVFGVIFLSTHLRSRTFLVFGSLALGAYLTKITVEYFTDSLGWAFALVLVGLMLMSVAYLALRVQRRYITAS